MIWLFIYVLAISLYDLRAHRIPNWYTFPLIPADLPATPIQTGILLLACIWGLFRNISGWLALPLLFYPPTWLVLFTGYGYRKGVIGRADLVAISGLACLFPLPAVLLSLLGLEVWRRFWFCRKTGLIPALPGFLLGMLVYVVLKLFW